MTEAKTFEVQMLTRLAEKVMGWRVLSASDFSGSAPKDKTFCYDHDTAKAYFSDGKHTLCWDPFESIADAWMLVEALRNRRVFLSVIPNETEYAAILDDGKRTSRYAGATAPLAICIAADVADVIAKRLQMEAAGV